VLYAEVSQLCENGGINVAYCIYLRKSRTDAEAEARGEGETLARHEKALLELAKRLRLNVTEIYREIVSGDTIAARPVMQQLLSAVEQGVWEGVLVMEVERLARGDTIDQGIVAQTFKFSDTKIVTPIKIYNPSDEFDEEYFEFGLFMSRREYKTINRRLQRGRAASVKEGKYVANRAPYGYQRVKLQNDKGFTLELIPHEADVVRLIFDLYINGELMPDGTRKRLGFYLIAKHLNEIKAPCRSDGGWISPTIRFILSNPVYCGKVRWKYRPATKKMVDGKVIVERRCVPEGDYVIGDGIHEAIIPSETFAYAQELMAKNPPRPVGENQMLKNPLAGLVVCGKCGRRLIRRPFGKRKNAVLLCSAPSCPNVSSALYLVERRILDGLAEWLSSYRLEWELDAPHDTSQIDIKRRAAKRLESELLKLGKQLDNIHGLLEQGIYSTDKFLERSGLLAEKIQTAKNDLAAMNEEIAIEAAREESRQNIIPKVEHLLEVYDSLPNAKAKNDMLKEILEKVVYTKESNSGRKDTRGDFEIVLFPKLPAQGPDADK